MKPAEKLEQYISLIRSIRYENSNGGAYAYLQFLAYTRELVLMLRSVKGCDKEVEIIEAMGWLFNEYLAVQFTHRHKVIFETKLLELNEVFLTLRYTLKQQEERSMVTEVLHAQAA